jgi:hypothetical protein
LTLDDDVKALDVVAWAGLGMGEKRALGEELRGAARSCEF